MGHVVEHDNLVVVFRESFEQTDRRHDVNTNMLFTWRREMGIGASASADDPTMASSTPSIETPVPSSRRPVGRMAAATKVGEYAGTQHPVGVA